MAATELTLKMNSEQARQSAENLSEAIGGITDNLKEATAAGDWSTVMQMSNAAANMVNSQKALKQQAIDIDNRDNARLNKLLSMGTRSITNPMNNVTMAMQGNIGGAVANQLQQMSGGATNMASFVTSLPKAAKLGLGLAGGALAVGAAGVKAGNAAAQQYESVLPAMDSFYGLYGEKRGLNYNNKNMKDFFSDANKLSKGTNMTVEDFMRSAMSYSAYGLSGEAALEQNRTDQKLARYRGISADSLQELSGLNSRFETGGSGAALAEAQRQNLSNGQTERFLNSLKDVVSSGIAEGYVKSTEEISNSVDMLYKLSGNNELFKGSEGVQRYQNMAEGIANSVNLSSSTDVLTYRAMMDSIKGDKTGDKRLDTLMALEAGNLSPDFMKNNFKQVMALTDNGNDILGAVELFKQQFGLNYAGAHEVYKMMINAKDSDFESITAKEITDILKNTDYQSNKSEYQDDLNELKTIITDIGEKPFKMKLAGLDLLTDTTSKIYAHIAKDSYKGVFAEENGALFSEYESKDKKNIGKTVDQWLSKDSTAGKAIEILDTLESLTPEQKRNLNIMNEPQKWDVSSPEKMLESIQSSLEKYGDIDLSQISSAKFMGRGDSPENFLQRNDTKSALAREAALVNPTATNAAIEKYIESVGSKTNPFGSDKAHLDELFRSLEGVIKESMNVTIDMGMSGSGTSVRNSSSWGNRRGAQ